MNKYIYQERKRRIAINITAAGTICGLIYPVLGGEFGDNFAFINGITIGFLGGTFIAIFELYLDNPLNKKIGFIQKLIYKSLIYTTFFAFLIILVIAFTGSLENNSPFFEYLRGKEIVHFIMKEDFFLILAYTLILCSAVIFTHQLSRKMGQGVLWNIISGKYRNPREEERIFMFLDLNHSTKIAENLGDINFNLLLNNFFYDITGSILSTYGEIYRYVGDEVVVTWKMKHGLRHAHCIRTFFLAKNAIRRRREMYQLKYGFLPTFSASFHYGKIIVGETGDIKSQISFSGDTLYTTAQIEKQCRQLNKEILVSEKLIKRIPLPEIYEMKLAGNLNNGKSQELDLYTVSEIEIKPL